MLVYLNEYNVASAVYTFHGESAKVWVDHVKRSQESYRAMRATTMDRTETRLMYLDVYDDTYEEDYAIFHAQDPLSEDSLGGVNSASDPNLLPRSTSHDQLRLQHQRLSMSTSFDGSSEGSFGGDHQRRRPKSMTFGETRRSKSPRPNLTIPNHAEHEQEVVERVMPSKSAGLHSEYAFFEGKPPIKAKPQLQRGPDASSHSPQLEMEETLRSKLNQRRTRAERRYHTADAIQELRREPDASIHKRLSWNLGTPVDINIDESQRGSGVGNVTNVQLGKGKTFSSDSLRSMPSSSGVSSTGSLHLSPDTEISEEYENEIGELVQSPKSKTTTDTDKNLTTESSTDDFNPDLETNTDSLSSTSDPPPPLPTSAPPDLRLPESASAPDLDTDESYADLPKSRSTDTMSFQNRGECKDGIGSVELQAGDDGKRKMTHGEILRMKKQLLLNSTLEAS